MADLDADIADATGQLFVPTQDQVGQQAARAGDLHRRRRHEETVISAATEIVGDLIFGNNPANTLIGTAGQDEICGQGAADIITGLAGNDILDGGTGGDTLNGGAGADAMSGGLGNDTYVVDSLLDSVTENPGEGTDAVADIAHKLHPCRQRRRTSALISLANGGPAPEPSRPTSFGPATRLNNIITRRRRG